MGKYDCLREQPNDDIVGVRRTRELSCSVLSKDHVRIILGLVPCPECGNILDIDFIKSKWNCPRCETAWSSPELIEAVDSGYSAPYLSIRDLEY